MLLLTSIYFWSLKITILDFSDMIHQMGCNAESYLERSQQKGFIKGQALSKNAWQIIGCTICLSMPITDGELYHRWSHLVNNLLPKPDRGEEWKHLSVKNSLQAFSHFLTRLLLWNIWHEQWLELDSILQQSGKTTFESMIIMLKFNGHVHDIQSAPGVYPSCVFSGSLFETQPLFYRVRKHSVVTTLSPVRWIWSYSYFSSMPDREIKR